MEVRMRHTPKHKRKLKRKWKITGFSLLGILVLGLAVLAIEYTQLLPKNHFKSLPVIGSSNENDLTAQAKEVKEPVFNVLIMGSDQRKNDKVGHSDSMILVHVDLNQKKFQAVSIPRDTRVYLEGYGYTKLTSVQYVKQTEKGTKHGIEAAVSAVSDLTGVPINYYVETNYWGLQSLVDAIGGINMNVPFKVKLTHPWYRENKNKVISAGTHSFDGKMVTEVVHERDSLPDGEFSRQKMQEEALKGIAKKSLSPANIGKLPPLVKSIPDFIIGTNMSTSDMLSMGLAVKDVNLDKQLQYHQLPGEGKTMYDDVLKARNWQFVMDPDQIKEIMSQYF
jgi:LCP family protein required for cell wall assembly